MKRTLILLLMVLIPAILFNQLVRPQRLNAKLRFAVINNKLAEADRLIKAGANPNYRESDGKPLIKFTLATNQIEMLKLLLDAGADPNRDKILSFYLGITFVSSDGSFYTRSNPEVVALLIRYGAEVNEISHNVNCAYPCFSPLTNAAMEGHTQIVELLLTAGANPNLQTENGWTALHEAVKFDQVDLVTQLLAFGAEPNIQDNMGTIALALSDNLEIFNTLLNAGADAEAVGITPLMISSFRGEVERSKQLLEAGADPDALDASTRNSPLLYASVAGHDEIVALLLAAGANPNRQLDNLQTELGSWKRGWTALHWATRFNQASVVAQLLAAGADPDMQEGSRTDGMTALQMAAYLGYEEIVELLLSTGTNPNLQNNKDNRQTALHEAVHAGHYDIVVLLLAAGADIQMKNIYGRTPLQVALNLGLADIAQILEAAAN